MKSIDIKVSFRCNNNCKFCVQGDKKQLCSNKTSNEINKILKDSRSEYEKVIYSGGEPTIRADIIDLVSSAKNLGYKIEIQTNGRMFAYKDFCNDMIMAGVEVFSVSIHGHNAKLHDYLTSAEGSFQQSIVGIRNLLSLGKLVVTNTVINKLNFCFLPEIANFLINLGIPKYQFAFPHILGNALTNREWIVPRKKEVIPYVKKGLKIGLRKKRIPKTEAIPYCFLDGYETCVAERDTVMDTKVFDISFVGDMVRWRKEVGKVKGDSCVRCKYFVICEGPWREYPQFYGWDEFIPVKR